MYTGNMIEELVAAVERVEEHSHPADLKLSKSVWSQAGSSTHIYEPPKNAEHMAVA
jgi:hypothetical protein